MSLKPYEPHINLNTCDYLLVPVSTSISFHPMAHFIAHPPYSPHSSKITPRRLRSQVTFFSPTTHVKIAMVDAKAGVSQLGRDVSASFAQFSATASVEGVVFDPPLLVMGPAKIRRREVRIR